MSALPKVAYSFRASAFGNGTAVGLGDGITLSVVGTEVGDGTAGSDRCTREKEYEEQ